MKKLLIALVALTMTMSAFAHHDDHTQNMIRFDNMDQANTARSFDVSFDNTDTQEESSSSNIAINYARAFGQWQVGLTYRTFSQTRGTLSTTAAQVDAGNTIGLSGYYNFGTDLENTCYLALHWLSHTGNSGTYETNFGSLEKDDSATTIALEYGHRWHIGHAWGLHLMFSPSVTYSMTSFDRDVDMNEDELGTTSTDLSWNWLKFDVMF